MTEAEGDALSRDYIESHGYREAFGHSLDMELIRHS